MRAEDYHSTVRTPDLKMLVEMFVSRVLLNVRKDSQKPQKIVPPRTKIRPDQIISLQVRERKTIGNGSLPQAGLPRSPDRQS